MTVEEKIAEINSRLRRSGGIVFFDMQKRMEMVTVVNAAPIPATYKHLKETRK